MVDDVCTKLREQIGLADNLLCERYAKAATNNGNVTVGSGDGSGDDDDSSSGYGIWKVNSDQIELLLENSVPATVSPNTNRRKKRSESGAGLTDNFFDNASNGCGEILDSSFGVAVIAVILTNNPCVSAIAFFTVVKLNYEYPVKACWEHLLD